MTLITKDVGASRLDWTDGRWHCEGKAVGNNDCLELLCPDGRFLPVRVEYPDNPAQDGPWLTAYCKRHNLEFSRRLTPIDRLRWPAA